MEARLVQDPVHGLIKISPLAYKIINTDVFKRLKGLKQLGCVHEVFPMAVHSRFEHSLGVMHIAGQLCEALSVSGRDKLCVEIAGLCHDLGHGPYSHLYEVLVRRANEDSKWTHEQSSLDMLDLIIEKYNIDLADYNLDETDLEFIKELINGPLETQSELEFPYKGRGPEKYFLYEIISNKITGVDVDKWDYFLRDNRNLQVGITFDYKRILNNVKIVEWPFYPNDPDRLTVNRIAIRDKEFDNCQEMFLDRSRLHRKAYQHRVTRIFDKMMIDAWTSANEHFPLIQGQNGQLFRLSEACEDPVALSKLTDDWINQTIRNSSNPELERARNIMKRIDDREKYKDIAEISYTSLPKSESEYENLLQTFVREQKSAILTDDDLCVIKNKINMGRKNGTNPVLDMLFCDKNGAVRTLKSEELLQIAPAQLAEEKLFIVCRRLESAVLQEATRVLQEWLKNYPDWRVSYRCQEEEIGIKDHSKRTAKRMSPIFGISASATDGRAEE